MANSSRSSVEQEQLLQTVQMFEVIADSQPNDIQSLEILKEAYLKLDRDSDAVETSKKIAKAYVQLGQLSSAILEYEGIIQKYPDDTKSKAALEELEAKMAGATEKREASQQIEKVKQFANGNETLVKFFQEHQLLSEKDANKMFSNISSLMGQLPPGRPAPSLIGLLSEHGIASVEKSLVLLSQKTRLPYIPLSSYDVDSSRVSNFEKNFCLEHLTLPFDRVSKTLFVATVNPFDSEAKAEVESKAEGRVQWYLTSPSELTQQLKDIFHIP